MAMLPDGTYDVVVVDADTDERGDVRIEVTITLGPHVGRVVPLRRPHLDSRRALGPTADPLSLLGLPGTLRVRNGVPVLTVEQA